jgi:hypothetical protein
MHISSGGLQLGIDQTRTPHKIKTKISLRFKIRVDSCSSIVMETKARFSPFEFADAEGPPDRTQYSSLAIRYKDKPLNLTGLQALSEETIDICSSLRILSALKAVASCHPEQNVEMVFYGDMLERLERRVVRMVQQKAPPFSTTDLVIYRLFWIRCTPSHLPVHV